MNIQIPTEKELNSLEYKQVWIIFCHLSHEINGELFDYEEVEAVHASKKSAFDHITELEKLGMDYSIDHFEVLP